LVRNRFVRFKVNRATQVHVKVDVEVSRHPFLVFGFEECHVVLPGHIVYVHRGRGWFCSVWLRSRLLWLLFRAVGGALVGWFFSGGGLYTLVVAFPALGVGRELFCCAAFFPFQAVVRGDIGPDRVVFDGHVWSWRLLYCWFRFGGLIIAGRGVMVIAMILVVITVD
jgi:hypothetical protein